MAVKEKPKATTNVRQKKLAKAIVENRGKPIGKLIKEAGYSEAYSTNPNQLMKTKSWQQLMEEYLPDDLIAEKHQALLNKKEQIIVRNGKESEVIVTDEIDANAVKAGVDMAYKIKGRYAPEKIEHTITAVKVVNYGSIDDGDNTTD